MSAEEWGRTFMPSLMPSEPATEPPADDANSAPTDSPTRGPDGKFMAANAASTDDTPADAPAAETEAATETTEPVVEEKPAVVLPFAAVGADDAPIDPAMLASMKVTLKANGAEVQMPLADVVRQAQSAAGASRQANELRTTMQQRESELQTLRQEQELLEQALVRALTDDDARAALAQQYAAYTSPEAELARLKAEQSANAERARMSEQQKAQEAQAITVMGNIRSQFESLLATYPEVTPQELLGQFNFDTAALAVNGVIPPEKFAEVEAYVAQSLTAFAQQRHQHVTSLKTKAEAAAKAAEQAARTAKSTMAAAVRPVGGASAPAANTKPAISTIKDASAYALSAFGPG